MTYHTLSDGLTESSVKTFWPLWLSFLWICGCPFSFTLPSRSTAQLLFGSHLTERLIGTDID